MFVHARRLCILLILENCCLNSGIVLINANESRVPVLTVAWGITTVTGNSVRKCLAWRCQGFTPVARGREFGFGRGHMYYRFRIR